MCTLPDEFMEKPAVKVPNKHIIPAEAIIVNKELGTGEFGVVQQGVWTNDGERVCSMRCSNCHIHPNMKQEFFFLIHCVKIGGGHLIIAHKVEHICVGVFQKI